MTLDKLVECGEEAKVTGRKSFSRQVLYEDIKNILISPVRGHIESRKIKIQVVHEWNDSKSYIQVNVFGFVNGHDENDSSYCLSKRYSADAVKRELEEKGYFCAFGHRIYLPSSISFGTFK